MSKMSSSDNKGHTDGWIVWAQWVAILVFLIGAQMFSERVYQYNLMYEAYLLLVKLSNQAYEFCGWTVVFFIPIICGATLIALFRILRISLPEILLRILVFVEEHDLHIGIGLLGTLWGFMEVASNSSSSGSPSDALTAILLGMGSTFMGVTTKLFLILVLPKDLESDDSA